nr:DUF1365 domain-containing protein [Bordetella sp. LUAb4]
MNSAIYEGRVVHRRHVPHPHAFAYRMGQLYLDLDEIDEVFRGRWLWSVNRPNLAQWRRADYLSGPPSLADAVRARLQEHIGTAPAGPIRLLAHPRYAGYVFNPVSFYYCYDADGQTLRAILAEITNTPWQQRHSIVLPMADATPQPVPGPNLGDLNPGRPDPNPSPDPSHGCDGPGNGPGRIHGHECLWQFDKHFHVSPFMPMDCGYEWRFGVPGERLHVHMRVIRQGQAQFDADLDLRRRALDGAALARLLWRYPLMTMQVIGAIHWQALRLWLKGNPVHDHPGTSNGEPR